MSGPKKRRKRKVPEPEALPMPPVGHQPSKAEQEAESDMPGLSRAGLRRTFMRPFRFKRDRGDLGIL